LRERKIRILIFSVLFLLTILVITSFAGQANAKNVKENHIYNGSSIYLNGAIISSTDSFYFIGKTNAFIFFYNQNTNDTKIYSVEKIDSIDLKIKRQQ
jgi:hypothetical protein